MADLCYLSKEFMHSPVLPFRRDSELWLLLRQCLFYLWNDIYIMYLLSCEMRNVLFCVQSIDVFPVVCAFFFIVFLANPYNWIKMASNAHC